MRARNGVARHRAKKATLKDAKGFRGARSSHWRTVLTATKRAEKHAFVGRKLKKRDMRSMWITRINIASREQGLSYSRLIAGLNKADIRLDRRQLSELAIEQPVAFAQVVAQAKAALG
ncbi:MAG: 50S ribosomal protein L20 [Planctomycetota bacterium]|nr:MAG: 50S ribosomal protein L20 [Planctomycetota bacterium]